MVKVVTRKAVTQTSVPMGKDKLILIKGDRLVTSTKPFRGKYGVYAVNGFILPTFYVPQEVIGKLERVKNG